MAHPVSQDRAGGLKPRALLHGLGLSALIPCAGEITVSPEAFATLQAALADPAEPTEALKRLMRPGADL